MALFPALKTGAGAQYGFSVIEQRPVKIQHYLDGTTRRFPSQRARRSWHLTLKGLSAKEAQDVGTFVSNHLESNAAFTFRDPRTGQEHSNCEVADSGYRLRSDGEHRFEAEIVVQQREV